MLCVAGLTRYLPGPYPVFPVERDFLEKKKSTRQLIRRVDLGED